MLSKKNREVWIDNVKVIACVLVVLGHFFQSMTKAEILPSSDLYEWFNQTIYCFHVPLFFICSGYLYQKYSKVDSFFTWKTNVLKKFLALGIPYFIFSAITWILKSVFSNSVNDEIGGLFETLFIHPTSPYWYLYCLFFIFLITPTFMNKKVAYIGLFIALALKVVTLVGLTDQIFVLSTIFVNEIWFVIGMCIFIFDFKKYIIKKQSLVVAIMSMLVFIVGSILVYTFELNSTVISFIVGIVACLSIISLMCYVYRNNEQSKIFGFFSKYTMPIFLMHTLFAAPLRSILMKFGITNPMINVVLGIVISFAGPIIAAEILSRVWKFDFILYPNKYIKIGKKAEE